MSADLKKESKEALDRHAEQTVDSVAQASGGESTHQLGESIASAAAERFEQLAHTLDSEVGPHSEQPSSKLMVASATSDEWLNQLDESFSHWQASVTSAFVNASEKQLHAELGTLRELTVALKEQVAAQEAARQEFEDRLAGLLHREAKTARQRKVIASQLKARRSEWLLERASVSAKSESETTTRLLETQQDLANLKDASRRDIESLEKERENLIANQEQSQKIIDELRAKITDLEATNSSARDSEVEEQRAMLELAEGENESLRTQKRDLESKLKELQEQVDQFAVALEKSEQEKIAFEDQESVASSEKIAELDARNTELDTKNAELKDQLELASENLDTATSELDVANSQLTLANKEVESANQAIENKTSELEKALEDLANLEAQVAESEKGAGEQPDQVEELLARIDNDQQDIETLRQSVIDLENQNADLAAQLAKHQLSLSSVADADANINQESLTWEERKQLILRQLEADDDDGAISSEEVEKKRLEVADVIRATESEIERRDREIASLQTIIEQQADARDGVAIGAAAVADMLESDELIQQERQRLKEIQGEWEEKLRKAEIDLSMERAKLARERSELEDAKDQLKEAAQTETNDAHDDKSTNTRKWLEHLGLRDS